MCIRDRLSSGKPLKKSKKVFDNKKITDHHAIIPTGDVYKRQLIGCICLVS